LILSFLLLFIACFSFSFGSVVWVLLSEFFPTSVRGKAVSFATLFIWLANWLVGQFFPFLNQWPALPFFVFGICSLLAFLLILKWIPETKGKTLEEI
jgi:SP family arabinose:H+ symporter-like MFS transporter